MRRGVRQFRAEVWDVAQARVSPTEVPLGRAHSGGQHWEPSSLPAHVFLFLCPAPAFKLPGAGFASGIAVSSVQQPGSLFLLPLCVSGSGNLVAAAPSVTE